MREPQIIRTPAGEELAVLPRAEYMRLREAADMLEDVIAYDRAKERLARAEDELIPFELAQRLLEGANPVRAWRKHRQISARQLAAAAGIAPSYLSQIESGQREGTVSTMTAIAKALRVSLDDLLPADLRRD